MFFRISFIAIIFSLGLLGEIYTQVQLKFAPLNPAFVKYQKKSLAKRKLSGYIPLPVLSRSGIPKTFRYDDDLPSQYDMRTGDLLTPIKDQMQTLLCWAYSSMGAVESQAIVCGQGNLDLSEEGMYEYQSSNYYGEGGNYQQASSYYSSFHGPVLDQDDNQVIEIDVSEEIIRPIEANQFKPKPLSRLSKILDLADTLRNMIKHIIYNTGAVATTLYFGNEYYNDKNYTYYCDSTGKKVNHGVVLVGWNDNMKTAASEPGAWIARNSWGTSFGDSGYFYLSYSDSVALHGENYIWPDIKDFNAESYLYMNDQLGGISCFGYKNKTYAYGLAKFETVSNLPITKIMTWTKEGDSKVSVRIYDNFDGRNLTGLLAESPDNYRAYAGYFMLDLPAPVYLSTGEDFYVEVKYEYPDTLLPPVPCELSIKDYCDPFIQTGKYWISLEGNSWLPLGTGTDYLVNLPIRAYAEPVKTDWLCQENAAGNNLYKIFFTNENDGYAVGDSGLILRTTNGGINWSSKSCGSSNNLLSIFFIDESTGWTVGDKGKIFQTTDRGETWSPQSSDSSSRLGEVYFTDENNGYAAGEFGKILKTTNGGIDWSTLPRESSANLNTVYFINQDVGFAAGQIGTILKTINGGKSWNFEYSGTKNSINSISFIDSSAGWAAADNGTILKTTDVGENWIPQPSPTVFNLNSVWFCDKDTGWIAGDNGTILRTTNAGISWSYQNSGTKNILYSIFFTRQNKGFAAGGAGTILKKIGGGAVSVEDRKSPYRNFILYQNYPNPFNPITNIKYSISQTQYVSIKIYDILGRVIQTLVNEEKMPGEYTIMFNGNNYPSGIYFYRIQAGKFIETKKFVLIK